jgi:hypothetical protein
MNSIGNIWEEILSRDPDRVKIAYNSLSDEERRHVSDHLKKMVSESGWHQEQKISAQTAINAISRKALI